MAAWFLSGHPFWSLPSGHLLSGHFPSTSFLVVTNSSCYNMTSAMARQSLGYDKLLSQWFRWDAIHAHQAWSVLTFPGVVQVWLRSDIHPWKCTCISNKHQKGSDNSRCSTYCLPLELVTSKWRILLNPQTTKINTQVVVISCSRLQARVEA